MDPTANRLGGTAHVAPEAELPAADRLVHEPHVDDLRLLDAVVGDGIVLNDLRDGAMVLHTVHAGRATRIGRFQAAGDALRALDHLDDPMLGPERRRRRFW